MDPSVESASVKFKPRDASFHLLIAVICIGAGAMYMTAVHVTPVVCMAIGLSAGLNLGVVLESERWKARSGKI